MSASKLRYAAYDAPPPVSRLRPRRNSNASVSSSLSGTLSDHSNVGAAASEGTHTFDVLSRTVTAGDLTLATIQDLEPLSQVRLRLQLSEV